MKSLKSNKEIEISVKLILVGNKARLVLLKNKNINEFFIDITFKIVPKIYRPSKAITIATIDKENDKTILICFAFIKFMDHITYKKVFQYLHENYGFQPKIIHIDYENAFAIPIKESEIFLGEIIHIRCLFHLIKSIRDKIRKLGLSSKKINKEIFEIIKNFEILCFII